MYRQNQQPRIVAQRTDLEGFLEMYGTHPNGRWRVTDKPFTSDSLLTP